MQIGLIGLGKMGFNLALNFKHGNHQVIAFDINKTTLEKIESRGISTASSIAELMHRLKGRRIIWIMVPAGNKIDVIIGNLKKYLRRDDIIIDGGNSDFRDSIRRCTDLRSWGVHFLDCGTNGGTEGALNGISAMVGGNRRIFDYCLPLFQSICVDNGYLYCGKTGSGHFTMTAYNGIQHGMVREVAKGIEEVFAPTSQDHEFIHTPAIWNHGSLLRSRLN